MVEKRKRRIDLIQRSYNMKTKTFEKFLEEHFISFREVGGVPIMKDNFEDMFSSYLESLEIEDLIKLGDLYGTEQYLAGKEEELNKLK